MSQSDKRVAIITGAAGGVGQSTVKKFAENGYIVIGTDIRFPDGLFEHDCVSYRTCDVTSEADWQALAEVTLSEHGKLDVLVNNAAILMTYTIETSSTEDYKRMMEVNSTSVFLGMKFLLDALKKSEAASIINISSSSALAGYPHFIAYGAAKAAVRSLTMSVAVHCQTNQFPIRCNSVHPDGILTDMTNNMEGTFPEMEPHQAMKAFSFACEPEAVTDVIYFLAGHESRHINGAEIRVDNSSTIQMPYLRLNQYEFSMLGARHVSKGTCSNFEGLSGRQFDWWLAAAESNCAVGSVSVDSAI